MMISFSLARLGRLGTAWDHPSHLRARLIVHKVGASPSSACIALHSGIGCGQPRLVEGESAATYHSRARFTNNIATAISAIVLNMVGDFHHILSLIKATRVWIASWTSHCTLRRILSAVHHTSRTQYTTIEWSRRAALNSSCHHGDVMKVEGSSWIHKLFCVCACDCLDFSELCRSLWLPLILLSCRSQKEARL